MTTDKAYRVAILGGGMAGLAAAHELVSANGDGPMQYDVTVYERNPIFGGKARSFPKPGSGLAERGDLPGEHGFRFFPSYYQHVPHTMERIPYADATGERGTVFDNLRDAKETDFAATKGPLIQLPNDFPENIHDLAKLFRFHGKVSISFHESMFFARRMLSMLCSSDQRRYEQYENMSWFDFSGAGNKSFGDAYRQYLADGLNQRTVAASGKDVSARTVGITLVRIVNSWCQRSRSIDRVLNGPTSDRWITPWQQHLESKGVRFVADANATKVDWSGTNVESVDIDRNGVTEKIEADYFIVATAVDCMQRIATNSEMRGTAAGIDGIYELSGDRMNGIQFFLDRDLRLAPGHTIYVDSEFALTSISQQMFWQDVDMPALGDGRVRGVLSVDISEWDQGCGCHNLPASAMTREQIKEEVWRQVKAHVNNPDGYDARLTDDNLLDWMLDPAVVDREGPVPPGEPATDNREPLFINRVGSWQHRPQSVVGFDNLFLEGDYVRTKTDLATMEAGNESGRRAARDVLERSGSDPDRVELFDFPEPSVFKLWRDKDDVAFADAEVGGYEQLAVEPKELPEEWGPEPSR
jgi:uncharacterized protein with NAD-binding domain and iron-sulfur cluster